MSASAELGKTNSSRLYISNLPEVEERTTGDEEVFTEMFLKLTSVIEEHPVNKNYNRTCIKDALSLHELEH